MSLGFRGFTEDFLPVTQILRARGVLPVFAVGNEGPGTSRSPGNYAEALSVGAMDEQGRVADFSSSRRFDRTVDPIVPDVVAPGVGVVSAKPGGGYQEMDGSSMATPHVAGLAALLMEADPAATIDQIEQAIFGSCAPLAGESPDRQNRGVPDAVKALSLLPTPPPPPAPAAAAKPAGPTRRPAAKPSAKGTATKGAAVKGSATRSAKPAGRSTCASARRSQKGRTRALGVRTVTSLNPFRPAGRKASARRTRWPHTGRSTGVGVYGRPVVDGRPAGSGALAEKSVVGDARMGGEAPRRGPWHGRCRESAMKLTRLPRVA